MTEAHGTAITHTHRVRCDGADAIRQAGPYRPAVLGHPRIWLEIDGRGSVNCPYCDRRFVLADEDAAHTS